MAEIVVERPAGGLGHVDLALVQPLAQLVRREVDQLDLGLVEHAVGHRLAHADMGDLRHHVVEALDVLDVHRGPDVDAGRQQLLDVHPALGVSAARGVVVGELVDQRQLRAALQQPVEIHLLQLAAAIGHPAARHDLEPGQQRRGLAPAMGLDQAHHHVDAVELAAPGRGQHLVGLADPGCGAEEDLEPPAPFLPRLGEQGLGRGSLVGAVAGLVGHAVSLARPPRPVRRAAGVAFHQASPSALTAPCRSRIATGVSDEAGEAIQRRGSSGPRRVARHARLRGSSEAEPPGQSAH